MKNIYLDSEFKCYVTDNGSMTPIETDFFNDKCDTFIEGYRFVPENESWTREDGAIFHGEMIAPWRDFNELLSAQKEYENVQLELTSSYQEGVNSI